MIRCKVCNSENIFFQEEVVHSWSVNNIDEEGFVDLHSVEWSFPIDKEGNHSWFMCESCKKCWSIDEYQKLPPYVELEE